MPEEIDVLKIVCNRLEKANIPYMLTGSLAANFYAVPRMTRDIDFVIEILTSEVNQFFRCFENDFYIDKNSILEAIQHQGMFNVVHNDSVFKVDFIIRKNILYRTMEFKRRQRLELDGVPVWIVSPEDLIISKLFWAKDSFSELQIRDIKNLLTSMRNLDKKYIEGWVKSLELTLIYERVEIDG